MAPLIAFAALAAILQDQPNQDGLALLKQIMQSLQSGKTSVLTGRRDLDGEFDGDFVIYRDGHTRLRYEYCGYFGDNEGLILTPKAMAIIDGSGNQKVSEAPKSWGARSEKPSADSNGGIAVSLLAPVADMGTFVDLKKDVSLNADKPGSVSFTHVSGTKVTVRLNDDKSVEIRVPVPGFGGFRPPATSVDIMKVKSTGIRLADWLFEVMGNLDR